MLQEWESVEKKSREKFGGYAWTDLEIRSVAGKEWMSRKRGKEALIKNPKKLKLWKW